MKRCINAQQLASLTRTRPPQALLQYKHTHPSTWRFPNPALETRLYISADFNPRNPVSLGSNLRPICQSGKPRNTRTRTLGVLGSRHFNQNSSFNVFVMQLARQIKPVFALAPFPFFAFPCFEGYLALSRVQRTCSLQSSHEHSATHHTRRWLKPKPQ